MAKGPDTAAPKTDSKPAGAPQQQQHGGGAPKTESKGKGGPTAVPGGCTSWGCKKEGKRFNFCEEHYDHFKFGLIKKTGEQVSDYERKWEHYQAFVAKRGKAHKVA